MAKPLHKSLQHVFEPRDATGIDLNDLSNEQKVARAEQVRGLLQNSGWKVMNELVFILTDSLKNSISTAKIEDVKYIQGQINGLEAWQNSASIVLDQGDLAQQEIETENDEAQARKTEPQEGHPR